MIGLKDQKACHLKIDFYPQYMYQGSTIHLLLFIDYIIIH